MFFNNYESLCRNKGLSPNAVAKTLSISSGSVTEWKKGRIPQNATLKKIADYFNVSTDYLLMRTEENDINKKGPSPEGNGPSLEEQLDQSLIRRLCALSPDELSRVDAFVQGLLANREA